MKRRTLHVVTAAVLLLVLGGAAGGWWWLAYGRWPLAGELRVDFGEVEIPGDVVELHHVFRLTNRSGRTLTIQTVKTTCGCTTVEWPRDPIEPGATIELPIILALTANGVKKSSAEIVLDDGMVQPLFLRALGHKSLAFEVSDTAFEIGAGGTHQLMVLAKIADHDDPPVEPTVRLPMGLESSFAGWTLVEARDPARHGAALWRGRVEIRAIGSLADQMNPSLWIGLGDFAPIMVRIRWDEAADMQSPLLEPPAAPGS